MAVRHPARLCELIALARELKGWSLRKLESECGVSNAMLSQIESGHVKNPSFASVVDICDALGIKLERAAQCVRRLTPEDLNGVLRGTPLAQRITTRKTSR